MQAVVNGNVICYDLMKSVDGSAGPPIIYLPGIFWNYYFTNLSLFHFLFFLS